MFRPSWIWLLNQALAVAVIVTALESLPYAIAGDYTVSYAFDGTASEDVAAGATSSLNEEGTTKECWYDRYCKIELPKSDLTISFRAERSERHKVLVFAEGSRGHSISCCYFSHGEQLAASELTIPKRLSQRPIVSASNGRTT